MRQRYTSYLALFGLSLALGACSKNSTPTPTIDFGANEGYTGRDISAVPTGPNDPTDWTSDATWNSSETGLFAQDYNFSFSKSPGSTNLWKLTAYPNPVVADGRSLLLAPLDRPSSAIPSGPGGLRMAYAVVDANYTVQTRGDMSNNDKNFAADFKYDATKYRANTLYRMYYVMYDDADKTVYYKGHGDIKVMP